MQFKWYLLVQRPFQQSEYQWMWFLTEPIWSACCYRLFCHFFPNLIHAQKYLFAPQPHTYNNILFRCRWGPVNPKFSHIEHICKCLLGRSQTLFTDQLSWFAPFMTWFGISKTIIRQYRACSNCANHAGCQRRNSFKWFVYIRTVNWRCAFAENASNITELTEIVIHIWIWSVEWEQKVKGHLIFCRLIEVRSWEYFRLNEWQFSVDQKYWRTSKRFAPPEKKNENNSERRGAPIKKNNLSQQNIPQSISATASTHHITYFLRIRYVFYRFVMQFLCIKTCNNDRRIE